MTTLGPSSSSNTSPRWGRTGEPGSAFNGLSRGRGRGRGGLAGNRGGRGRTRGGLSTRDSAISIDNIPSTKPDNSQSSPSPSTKSSISPSVSTPVTGKPNIPPTFSPKPKPGSRRGSRATAVAAVPQINESVETPASTPTSAKLSHKRRRSQAGKPALHAPPKANLTTSTVSSESHTETLKDIPPHLNNRFDVRNDIDALVERVRAVAMDNRPSSPKSHIDWAVDDDDTLPDLDDWGVTTTTLTAEVISPIIVDGLRSLPEFSPSPLKQVEAVMIQPTIDAQSNSVDGRMPDKVVPPNPLGQDMRSKFLPEPIAKHDPRTAMPLNSKMESTQSISVHPSLPVKPLIVDSIVQHSKPWPRASPMRTVPHPKSPITPTIDLSRPQKLPAVNSEQTGTQEPAEVPAELIDHKMTTWTPEPTLKGPEYLIVMEPTVAGSVISDVSSDRASQTAQEHSPPRNTSLSGLSASMHAPKGIADSVSAPADLTTYADFRAYDPIHTHTRAHTVGRSPLPDSTLQGDYMSRFTRSGHTTPRGGSRGNSHARTHSTPPGGANHHRSPQSSRPVITGDAISRLARTIGKTHNNISPPKSHSTVTLGS